MLEITFWAASRAHAVAFLKAVNICDTDPEGNFVPIAEVQIHPSRPDENIAIIKTPAVMDGMTVVTPAEYMPGWHANLRFYGSSEQALIAGLPQTDADGHPLGLFERSRILDLVEGRTGLIPQWQASAEDPIPPGYEAAQCRAFDPSLISTRANVWA
jgi:hypothetical protein